jgi:hypothetical protein
VDGSTQLAASPVINFKQVHFLFLLRITKASTQTISVILTDGSKKLFRNVISFSHYRVRKRPSSSIISCLCKLTTKILEDISRKEKCCTDSTQNVQE